MQHIEKLQNIQARQKAATDAGVPALQRLYKVAQGSSGQCRYLARFLASCYNGYRCPFDLTDLRAIDHELWLDCMAVLAMDAHPAQEVHRYFEDGGKKNEEPEVVGGCFSRLQQVFIPAVRQLHSHQRGRAP